MSSINEPQSASGAATDKPACFVLMPISDPEGYEKGHFRRVYEDLFVPACDKAGYKAVRADEVRQANLIHLDILQKLIESPMALCDLSSRNPNALFELGLRQAFDKPVVLVQEVGTPQIFDIAPLRYVEYRRHLLYREVLEDQISIAEAIEATQEAFASGTGVNSIVKLLSLTSPASLKAISDTDKESAMLQVIMAELANLRTDVNKIARQNRPHRPIKSTSHSKEPVDEYVGPVSPQIQLLARSIFSLRDMVDAWVKGLSTPSALTPSELVMAIDDLLQQREGLLKHSIAIGRDVDVEYLALLLTQLRVLKNKLNKYIQSTKEDNS